MELTRSTRRTAVESPKEMIDANTVAQLTSFLQKQIEAMRDRSQITLVKTILHEVAEDLRRIVTRCERIPEGGTVDLAELQRQYERTKSGIRATIEQDLSGEGIYIGEFLCESFADFLELAQDSILRSPDRETERTSARTAMVIMGTAKWANIPERDQGEVREEIEILLKTVKLDTITVGVADVQSEDAIPTEDLGIRFYVVDSESVGRSQGIDVTGLSALRAEFGGIEEAAEFFAKQDQELQEEAANGNRLAHAILLLRREIGVNFGDAPVCACKQAKIAARPVDKTAAN